MKDVRAFTGREEQLQKLEKLLLSSQGAKVCSIVGISGLGGIGKSALAFRFANKHKDEFPDGVIGLRVDGKELNTVAREFVRRCGVVLDVEDDRDAATLMQDVFAHRKMLLIFDNAEDASIKKLRPSGNHCAVIVTTRRRNLLFSLDIGENETIDLPPLSEADALTLLQHLLGSDRVKNAVSATKRLIKLVGNLPLALHVLGSALQRQRESLDVYANALEEEKNELFEELKVDVDRDLNVEASLNLSLRSLLEDEVDFFACLSVCAAEGFTKQTAMAATGCERSLQAQRRLKQLYDLSLLNYVDTGENRFVLHPLVRVYAEALAFKRGLLTIAKERHAKFFMKWIQSIDEGNENVINEFATNLDDVILAAEWLHTKEPDSEQSKIATYQFALKLQPLFEKYGYWQKAITLMARFQSLAEHFQDWNSVVRYKMHEARYWSFIEAFEQAEEILNSTLVDLQKIDDFDARKRREAKVINVLAGVLQKQGKIEEAIQVFQAEILIEEEISDYRSLAIIYNRLGGLFQKQGKLEDSRKAFERQIEISEVLNDQSSFAIGLNCLGGLLQQHGKLEDAQKVFERYIEISEVLNDQSQLAIGLNRLGRLLQQQRKLKDAQKAFERSIEISEVLNDRSQLVISLNCLGGLLQQQRKLEEAQKAFEREIEISEALNDQSQLVIGLNCLGGLLQQQRKLEDAQKVFERQIEISEVLNDQSQLAIGLNRLGGLLQQQRKLKDAQKAFERSIEISEVLNDQSQLVISLNCLGGLLQQQEEFEKAQKVFERSIEISEALNDRSSLLIGLYFLQGLLLKQGKFQEIEIYLQHKVSIAETTNDQHKLVIWLKRLRIVLQKLGKLEEATNTLLRILAIEQELNNYEGISSALTQLGNISLLQEKFDLSHQYFDRAIIIAQDFSNKAVSTSTLNTIGITLHQHGGFLVKQRKYLHRAIEILEKSQAVFESLNVRNQIAGVLHTLGRVWKLNGDLERSEIFLKQSQDIFENEQDLVNLVKLLNTLGSVLEKQERWSEAEKVLRQSYDLAYKLEDKRGQAITANSLGQLIAHQDGEETFKVAQMYFRESIKLGEEIDDQKHLAKVHTAMGQTLIARRDFESAVESLSKGFEIDINLSNIRGLKIVTPNLISTLIKLGKTVQALEYCDQALQVAPYYAGFLQLRDKIQKAIATGNQEILIKTGSVLYIRYNEKDKLRWGRIIPDDRSSVITFNEKFIGSKTISNLTQGTLVEVEFTEKYGKLYASKIRVIEDEETMIFQPADTLMGENETEVLDF